MSDLHESPNVRVAEIARAQHYFALAEAAEEVARQWRLRAASLLTLSQTLPAEAVEELAEDRRAEAPEALVAEDPPEPKPIRRRATSANIAEMIREGRKRQGISLAHMLMITGWSKEPDNHALYNLINRRNLTVRRSVGPDGPIFHFT